MTLHHGDCLEVMAGMDPESVDAIVTDPPYGLEFMGKAWDTFGRFDRRDKATKSASMNRDNAPVGTAPTYVGGSKAQAFHAGWAEAAFRVAKPSAYLLAFGGTRTVHRMTCAIEDAGWIVRDMLVWAYASGFPKSKASLKPAWEPIVMARKPGPLRMLAIDATRLPTGDRPTSQDGSGSSDAYSSASTDLWHTDAPSSRNPSTVLRAWSAAQPSADSAHLANALADALDPRLALSSLGDYPSCPRCDGGRARIARAVVRRRTPSQPDVLVAHPDPEWSASRIRASRCADHPSTWDELARVVEGKDALPSGNDITSGGRWPANLMLTDPIFDGGIEGVVGGGEASYNPPGVFGQQQVDQPSDTAAAFAVRKAGDGIFGYGDSGTYSRFFLIPKSSRSDREPVLGGGEPTRATSYETKVRACRECGDRTKPPGPNVEWPACGHDDWEWTTVIPKLRANVHPTVKPTDLMRHLVRLVTPTGGTVLDPFLGSGTTALAAEMEGFGWVGIEREAEYVKIAEARLNGVQRGLGLEAS